MDEQRRSKLLRRDAELARLVERVTAAVPEAGQALVAWAAQRDAERRSLATEALERYTELNLLYVLAEQYASLDPAAVANAATTQLRRAVKRGTGAAFVIEDDGRSLRPINGDGLPAGLPEGFAVGEGILGAVATEADGEIVADPAADPRATESEAALGALMVAPLRAGNRRLGVLLVVAQRNTEFTAGEFRLLSAVAALTAPILDAALSHQRTLALAREREHELERQLEALRSEVEERRREERVGEITSSDYFRSLREQADGLRRTLNAGAGADAADRDA